ncbi:GNAT family N-acetyltransferase [Plantactinospora sp. CA-290183]|uniref:GNAT family N-acetyltransferase n=1 Tax=Plantactinospora sp. CA-290183 TaxID=3240006 RepID=UPI003D9113EC
MTRPRILPAAPDQAEQVAALIAKAIRPSAISQWLVPDPDARLSVLTADCLIWVLHAFETGTVYVAEDVNGPGVTGAAVWFDRTRDLRPPARYEELVRSMCGPWAERFFELDEAFDSVHPTAPHEHLAYLAVVPPWQGKGIGAALLAQHHLHLDAVGSPAYAEASERAVALYARHGYRQLAPVHLPDGGPPFWPMTRSA